MDDFSYSNVPIRKILSFLNIDSSGLTFTKESLSLNRVSASVDNVARLNRFLSDNLYSDYLARNNDGILLVENPLDKHYKQSAKINEDLLDIDYKFNKKTKYKISKNLTTDKDYKILENLTTDKDYKILENFIKFNIPPLKKESSRLKELSKLKASDLSRFFLEKEKIREEDELKRMEEAKAKRQKSDKKQRFNPDDYESGEVFF